MSTAGLRTKFGWIFNVVPFDRSCRRACHSIGAAVANAHKATLSHKPSFLLGLPTSSLESVYTHTSAALCQAEDLLQRLKSGSHGAEETVAAFDQISNVICKVADWAECVRNVHPDPAWIQASERCHQRLYLFVESLNCDYTLYEILKSQFAKLKADDQELLSTAQSLILDFEHSGILLGSESNKLLHLQETVFEQSKAFLRACNTEVSPTPALEATQLRLLNSILDHRHSIAQLLGFRSYADMVLSRTMAGSKIRVLEFLCQLADDVSRKSAKEISAGVHSLSLYQLEEIANCTASSALPESVQMVSMARAFEVLDELLTSCFGICLLVDSEASSFVWSASIIKFLVKDVASNCIIGTFYCDLYSHPNKQAGCSHYTLTGRKVDSGDNSHQLPSVYLTMNLVMVDKNNIPHTHLSCVSSIFHEMGHCLHSLLYRGRYQHLSGTRCSIDIAEIPSTLFENFLLDPTILRKLQPELTHHQALQYIEGKNAVRYTSLLKATINSIVDVSLHAAESTINDCSGLINRAVDKFDVIRKENHASHYLFMGHLIHYSSRFYSYIWAEGCAGLIWKELFEGKQKTFQTSEKFRKCFLEKGAIHDGFTLMNHTLGRKITTVDIVRSLTL